MTNVEEITQKQADEMIKQGKEEIEKIIADGGKVTKTIIYEKDKVTTMVKIEPVNGKITRSKVIKKIDCIIAEMQ